MISAFFSTIPSWLLFLVLVGGSIVLACISLSFIRSSREPVTQDHSHDAIGFVFATVSVIYAVVLGFLVVSAWEAYDAAQHAVSNEAAAIITTARYSATFPEPMRSEIRDQLYLYTQSVVNDEWPMMQGDENVNVFASTRAITALQSTWNIIEQQNEPNAVTAGALNNVSNLTQPRILRIMSREGGIPDYFWLILLLGSTAVIFLSLILHVEDRKLHFTLVITLTCSIAICLWLIAVMNNPFGGSLQVSSSPLKYALHVLITMSHQ